MGGLGILAGLQSLRLHGGGNTALIHGLPLVAQGCCRLNRLELFFLLAPPQQQGASPQSPQLACLWPTLVGLQLCYVDAGVVNHVLPSPQTAPQLACFIPLQLKHQLPKGKGHGWPEGLEGALLHPEYMNKLSI